MSFRFAYTYFVDRWRYFLDQIQELSVVYKFACMMIVCMIAALLMFWHYIVLWIQISFSTSSSHQQTIPFFEALAVLDQLQTSQQIHNHLILSDKDFKMNMGLGGYHAEFFITSGHLKDSILTTYEGHQYYHQAGYIKKNLERSKYMKKKGHTGVMMEYPLGLRLISTDRIYLYYITQDLGMRYSYLYNLYDGLPLYMHGDLVYSYLGNSIFFTYDHELPYEFILLNKENKLITNEIGGFLRNLFVDGRYLYMYIDDFQGQSRINVYDARSLAGLYKIPFGSHDTARIGFSQGSQQVMIDGYVINKLYLYIKYYDTNNESTYLKKVDLIQNKVVASLQM